MTVVALDELEEDRSRDNGGDQAEGADPGEDLLRSSGAVVAL